MVQDFHAAGACHADLNAHNILLDQEGKAWLLDFDRGRFRAPGAWQARNLARLERSLRKIAAEPGAAPFSAAGWEALQAAYREARDLRLRLRARRP
jgi:3-deoxy-D-manno-octulosonic acid kinase